MAIEVDILGCGTSTGVPVLGCSCRVCTSGHPRNQRWRTSIAVRTPSGQHVVIDTGPEFRLQVLRAGIKDLQRVLYTHIHADHVHGFDDLRGLYFNSQRPISCWLHPEYIKELRHRFHYAFEDTGYLGGRPELILNGLPHESGVFSIGDMDVETFLVPHGNTLTNIFRLGRLGYATDFKTFTEEAIRAWRGKIHTLIASGLRWKDHKTHSTIPETLELFRRLDVERGVITHMSHDIDYPEDSQKLPSGVELAYDGMKLIIP